MSNAPLHLFGIRPSVLVGHPLSDFVDVFSQLKDKQQQLLGALVSKDQKTPGFSWRVALKPPADAVAAGGGGSGDAPPAAWKFIPVAARQMKAAVLQVELEADEEEDPAAAKVKVHLYRADAYTCIVEVDKKGIIQVGGRRCCGARFNLTLYPYCCGAHATMKPIYVLVIDRLLS